MEAFASGALAAGSALQRLDLGTLRRAYRTLEFTEDDANGATRRIRLNFKPTLVLAISTLTAVFGGVFKPLGGLSVGFADLGKRTIEQFAMGPVAHLVSQGQEIEAQRVSAISPSSIATLPGKLNGIALGLLQWRGSGADEKEVLLVRFKRRNTLELKRHTLDSGSPAQNFRLETRLILAG